jgi:hypothetical protein
VRFMPAPRPGAPPTGRLLRMLRPRSDNPRAGRPARLRQAAGPPATRAPPAAPSDPLPAAARGSRPCELAPAPTWLRPAAGRAGRVLGSAGRPVGPLEAAGTRSTRPPEAHSGRCRGNRQPPPLQRAAGRAIGGSASACPNSALTAICRQSAVNLPSPPLPLAP